MAASALISRTRVGGPLPLLSDWLSWQQGVSKQSNPCDGMTQRDRCVADGVRRGLDLLLAVEP